MNQQMRDWMIEKCRSDEATARKIISGWNGPTSRKPYRQAHKTLKICGNLIAFLQTESEVLADQEHQAHIENMKVEYLGLHPEATNDEG